ncbi:MAG: PIN domain-containing protein [Alphaproteobacteria bacterium]|nr:PIN domain-containing protein [Alphaproteobacteria bacterium]
MIVDTSALIEVLFAGPHASAVELRLRGAQSLAMSAVSLVEAHIVVRRRLAAAVASQAAANLDALNGALGLTIEPVDAAMARAAIEAYARYGKGAGGALNFGDCFAYALARVRNDSLLFVGEDFRRTDVLAAM